MDRSEAWRDRDIQLKAVLKMPPKMSPGGPFLVHVHV
jgi:hypothetical protein